MHKPLFQTRLSEEAYDHIQDRKKELGIKYNRQYFLYLLKKDKYKPTYNDF